MGGLNASGARVGSDQAARALSVQARAASTMELQELRGECARARSRGCPGASASRRSSSRIRRSSPQSSLACAEKGRVASTTNMTSWSRLEAPALKTTIGTSAPCPVMAWPASA